MQLQINNHTFKLSYHNQVILEHTKLFPMIYVGCGEESLDMYRGNYHISDYIVERYQTSIKGSFCWTYGM